MKPKLTSLKLDVVDDQTRLIIEDNCGAGLGAMRDVVSAAQEVMDGVRKHSGLPLPGVVRLRLVTPREFRRVNLHLFRESFTAVEAWYPEIPKEVMRATRLLTLPAMRATMRVGWRGVGGQFIPACLSGCHGPQVLIMPKALRSSSANYKELRVIVGHELTHCAQHEANRRVAIDAIAQPIRLVADKGKGDVRERRKQLAQFSPVIEGHAQWVHSRIAKDLYGSELRDRAERFDGRGSLRYRFAKRVMRMNPVMSGKAKHYDMGEAFISAVYEAGGLPLVNRLWEGVDAMPDQVELDFPAAWISRMGA